MEQEIDLILKKKDVVKGGVEDWKRKRAPAIVSYAKTLKGKAAKYSTEVLERKFSSKATPLLNQYVVVYIKP